MAMTTREKRFVQIGGALVPVILLLFLIKPLKEKFASTESDSDGSYQEFKQHANNVKDLRILTAANLKAYGKLGLNIPKGSEDEQTRDFKSAVESMAKSCSIKIPDFTPRKLSGTSRRPGSIDASKRAYSFTVTTNQSNLLKLLQKIETFERPFVVAAINMQGNEKSPDQIKVAIEFYTYLFKESKSLTEDKS